MLCRIWLPVFLLVFVARASDDYAISKFVKGKVLPAAQNNVIAPLKGNALQVAQSAQLRKGQVFLRRKFGINEYGLFEGKFKPAAYQRLSVFSLPKGIPLSQAVKLKFYGDAQVAKNRPTMDIRDLFFDSEYLYAANRVSLAFKHQGRFTTLQALARRPAMVMLMSHPAGAEVRGPDNQKLGECPFRLVRAERKQELLTFSLFGYYKVDRLIDFVPGTLTEVGVVLKKVYVASVEEARVVLDTAGRSAEDRLRQVQAAKNRIRQLIPIIKQKILEEEQAFIRKFPALSPRGEFEKTSWYQKRKKKHQQRMESALGLAVEPLKRMVAEYEGSLEELDNAIKNLQGKAQVQQLQSYANVLEEYYNSFGEYLDKDLSGYKHVADLAAELKQATALFDAAQKRYNRILADVQHNQKEKYVVMEKWELVLSRVQKIMGKYQAAITRIRDRSVTLEFPAKHFQLGSYNADEEYFPVALKYRSGEFDFRFVGSLPVGIEMAQNFRGNLHKAKAVLKYRNQAMLCVRKGKMVRRFVEFAKLGVRTKANGLIEAQGRYTFPPYILRSESWRLAGMKRVPGGCFQMGSDKGDINERPVHRVCLDSFWMDTHEVMQKDFAAKMGTNPSFFKDCGKCPAENVTWSEADAYCQRLGKRLPTEAEWEYAARAGKKTAFYWGPYIDTDYAWFAHNSKGRTHPVGTRKPNALGLHDMIGNVWEWCNDWYSNRYDARHGGQNPTGPATGNNKVLRGGSWDYFSQDFSVASRLWHGPSARSYYFGFRCAR